MLLAFHGSGTSSKHQQLRGQSQCQRCSIMLDSPIPQLLCLSEQHQVQMVFSGLMSVAAEISLCARFETCSFLCLLDMMELTQCLLSFRNMYSLSKKVCWSQVSVRKKSVQRLLFLGQWEGASKCFWLYACLPLPSHLENTSRNCGFRRERKTKHPTHGAGQVWTLMENLSLSSELNRNIVFRFACYCTTIVYRS